MTLICSTDSLTAEGWRTCLARAVRVRDKMTGSHFLYEWLNPWALEMWLIGRLS